VHHSFTAAVVAVLFSVGAGSLGAQVRITGDAGGAPGRYHPLYMADSTWAALDTERIARHDDGTLSVWISWDYIPTRQFSFLPSPADHMMQRQDVDCAERRMRPRIATYYAPDGAVLKTYEGEADRPWTPVVPATIGEAVLDEVCAYTHDS
jgi:hypothetical protein